MTLTQHQNLVPQILPYVLPLPSVATSRGIFNERRGWLLRLPLGGCIGQGEVAPWPGFGTGMAACTAAMAAWPRCLREARLHADALLPPHVAGHNTPTDSASRQHGAGHVAGHRAMAAEHSRGRKTELQRSLVAEALPHTLASLFGRLGPQPIELRSALAQALADAWAQLLELPLNLFLSPFAAQEVALHALVDTAFAAQQAVANGARALKIKVGRALLDDEGGKVMAIRCAVGPNIAIRLDANGAWPRAVALQAAKLFAAAQPDWLEQPVAGADIDGLAELCAANIVPIAADEALCDDDAVQQVLTKRAAHVLVVKPSFVGGPQAALALAKKAAGQGMRSCVTHAFETPVGRMGALHTAAAVGSDEPMGLSLHTKTAGSGERGGYDGGHRLQVPDAFGLGLGLWP